MDRRVEVDKVENLIALNANVPRRGHVVPVGGLLAIAGHRHN